MKNEDNTAHIEGLGAEVCHQLRPDSSRDRSIK
ncbi:hypothetical protein DET65_0357 [Sunxiuqinia elliptica]|uniref:Uncharacterized protein n=1 Tax=Sunxiuqinia elliptica TaxID=655355 RepID=A0A4R6GST3_9BACT|nr:hypothetical protein DET52_10937 [Sunxiuqinia elliptica]TDO66990.1 hypothetical protein DET65_0357 [Sunxiuqinia elliptica]